MKTNKDQILKEALELLLKIYSNGEFFISAIEFGLVGIDGEDLKIEIEKLLKRAKKNNLL